MKTKFYFISLVAYARLKTRRLEQHLSIHIHTHTHNMEYIFAELRRAYIDFDLLIRRRRRRRFVGHSSLAFACVYVCVCRFEHTNRRHRTRVELSVRRIRVVCMGNAENGNVTMPVLLKWHQIEFFSHFLPFPLIFNKFSRIKNTK